ncbi:uncharacterized protein LOC111284747 [Durio zibethinus]|uniref:Uncharacterized protein LOC111284747 n=1 Tax=Durio zibethinus TaxID=66656 RepID=A0A6P5XMI5_DURZI|nr:uncharacterized protein LOC111284747 [Durio zibethinus]
MPPVAKLKGEMIPYISIILLVFDNQFSSVQDHNTWQTSEGPEGSAIVCSFSFQTGYWLLENFQDELEITSKVLGRKGSYSGIIVLVRNKVTAELIAEGCHSLFGKNASKL